MQTCWLAAGRSAASWRLKKTEESKRDTGREGEIRLERSVFTGEIVIAKMELLKLEGNIVLL